MVRNKTINHPWRSTVMIRYGSLFSQVLGLIDRNNFSRAARDVGAEKGAKGFSCWDQFVSMLFCQLAQAKSLREIVDGLACCEGKLIHLGMRAAPSRSTLSYANAHRSWKLYEKVFYQLLEKIQPWAPRKKFRFKNKLFSLDATVIDLCLSIFDWAKYRQTKGAIKLHLLLDHEGYLPVFAHITDGKCHELDAAKLINFPSGSIVVMDRAYTDYKLFESWTRQGVFFVTRLKDNANHCGVGPHHPPQGQILQDRLIALNPLHFPRDRKCKEVLRKVEVWIEEKQQKLVLLTNIRHLAATTIAKIYKDRWQIELFFKALKQNLKIKTFIGTTANAVHIQIWTALIAMLLIKFLQFRSAIHWALSNLVALIRWNLFTYRDLWQWIDKPFDTPPRPPDFQQLHLNLDSILPQHA